MEISNFDELLMAARGQPEPQRLLFVFAGAELPDESTPQQRERFFAGQGGALVPRMSADKTPEELDTFSALVEESRQFEHDWAVVFIAGLPGRDGAAPTSAEAERPLKGMIESIKAGSFGAYVAFDRQGQPVLVG